MNDWQGVQASGARIPSLEARIAELVVDLDVARREREVAYDRVAELEAECVRLREIAKDFEDQNAAAGARIAELEAELASVRFSRNANWAAADKAEARLAAVIALCDRWDANPMLYAGHPIDDIRAAATGDPT